MKTEEGRIKDPEAKAAKAEEKEGEKLDFSSGIFAKGGITAQKLSFQIANSATVTAKVEF